MHILLNYMYYLRPGDAGIRRYNEFCRLWAEQSDVRMTVLAGNFNHQTRIVYHDLVGKDFSWEEDGAVKVLRIGSPDTHGRGLAFRAWSQYSWAQGCVRALGMVDKPDIVLSSSPPLWAALPMMAAKRRWKIPAVLEVRDLWPDFFLQTGAAGPYHPAVLYLSYLERLAYSKADHIVALIETMIEHIARRGLKPRADMSYIPNGILLENYENLPPETRDEQRTKLGLGPEDFAIMYAGGMGSYHAAFNLLDLAVELKSEGRFKIIAIGDGPDRAGLEERARAERIDNLRFLGPVPTGDIPAYWAAADCGVVFAVKADYDRGTRGVMRNAFFDIAGAKKPLLFNIPGYPEDEIMHKAQGGYYCAETPEMAQRIRRLATQPDEARQMGENNYRHVALPNNRRKMADDYLALLRRLCA